MRNVNKNRDSAVPKDTATWQEVKPEINTIKRIIRNCKRERDIIFI